MATKEINARRARGMTIANIKLIVMLDEETDALMDAICSRLKLTKSALARLAIMRAGEELVPGVAAARKAHAERCAEEHDALRRFAPDALDERAAAAWTAGLPLPKERLMKMLVWAARGAQTPEDVAEVTDILGQIRG